MDGIIYLNIDQALAIHAKTIEYSGGGALGQLDIGRLDAVLQHKYFQRTFYFFGI